jgi:hypothetical protein
LTEIAKKMCWKWNVGLVGGIGTLEMEEVHACLWTEIFSNWKWNCRLCGAELKRMEWNGLFNEGGG